MGGRGGKSGSAWARRRPDREPPGARRGAAPVGAGDRHRCRLDRRRPIRSLRLCANRAGFVDRRSGGRAAGSGPRLRACILGTAASLSVHRPGVYGPDSQRRRCHPARFLDRTPGGGFPRGSGRGGRRRGRQSAARSGGCDAARLPTDGSSDDRDRRDQLPAHWRRARDRADRPGRPAEGTGCGSGDSRPGHRGLHHRHDGVDLRRWHEGDRPGRIGLSQGPDRGRRILDRRGLAERRDLSAVRFGIRRWSSAEWNNRRRLRRHCDDGVRRTDETATQSDRAAVRFLGIAGNPNIRRSVCGTKRLGFGHWRSASTRRAKRPC